MNTPALASIRQRLGGRRLRIAAAALIVLALSWTLLAGWALPLLAKPRIEAAASEALGAPLTIERLSFAPWSLRATLEGLRLGPAEAPWLRIARIVADGSTESLWRFAPVLERVEVNEPVVELERLQARRFNVSPLLDALARRPPAPADAKPARFALYNLRLAGGRMRFVDRVAGTEHLLDGLSLGVPFVSNLPSKIAIDVEPQLVATLDGSRIDVQGRTLPFQQGLRSSIDVNLSGIDVVAWAEALASQFPQQLGALPFEPRGGRLDVALHIDFERRDAPEPPLLRVTGSAALSGFAARVAQPALDLAVDRLAVEGLDLRPLAGEARIAKLRVHAPKLEADLARLTAKAPPEATSAQAAAPARGAKTAFAWAIDAIELDAGALALSHGAWLQPRRFAIESLRVDGLGDRSGAAPAALLLRGADDEGAKLQLEARIALAERHVAAKARLEQWAPAAWLLPWRDLLPVRIGAGRIDLRAEVDASPAGWTVSDASAQAVGIEVRATDAAGAAVHAFKRIDAKLAGASSDMARPVAFELSAEAGRSGRIELKGEVVPQPLALASRVEIAAFDLAGLQPYLEPRINATLQSAKLDAKGELKLEGTALQPLASLRWKGAAALRELRARDKLNDAELLRFRRLSLDGSELLWRASPTADAAAPLQADLGRVSLEDFYGRVIIDAESRVNLRDIVVKEGGDRRSLTRAENAAPGSAPAAAKQPEAPGAQLRWQGIRVARGEIDFTDNFIRPNYSARLTGVAGEVAALAWSDPQPAAVKLAGRVDGSAPLEIGGSIHPLGARLATDITASARGIDITRLSGYSTRYAGYGVEKGTLTMRVRYRIKDGRLEAENQLVLDQLTFGDRVESPNALKLPVQLAVALLKDRNGVIDVNLPVSGSLDDPQFSIGGVIARVLVNLITKAVTAPFSLLANAFGGGNGKADDLGHVAFAPGSSELDDAATQRLDALAKALIDRPALKLEATGHADRAADEAALRQQHVERLMRAAKAKSLGELPDGVTLGADERDRWLAAAYKAAELKTKPRNALGFTKDLPPAEMRSLLAASAPIDDAALRALADRRGDRVKAELVARVPPERVLLTASKLGRDGLKDDGPTPRVDFALR
ncbi:MAG TPA: DUF748 domain-containing protein [Methylibium sp.]|uniref:DUF748 domain-containing protein n=1 Tax=Methylibium sp. TaxID=2067992 RepID=UPI002DB715A1|nr:DUF748 domain-containing protein [Methylibium sp.]HEU4457658.1 DUF748 domain-containing protein [Methylibium sp.]